MNKGVSSAVTGVAVAMIAGTAAYMMSGQNSIGSSRQGRRLKKSAGSAIRKAGVVIDGVSQLLR